MTWLDGDRIAWILGVFAIITAAATFARWLRRRVWPWWRVFRADAVSVRNVLIGHGPVLHPITKEEIAPAEDGVGIQVAQLRDVQGQIRGQIEFAYALKDAPSVAELRKRVDADPSDHAARDLLGLRLLLDGDPAGGLDQLLSILKADRTWNDGQAKKHLVAAFSVLDDADLVGTYRRKMSSLLF